MVPSWRRSSQAVFIVVALLAVAGLLLRFVPDSTPTVEVRRPPATSASLSAQTPTPGAAVAVTPRVRLDTLQGSAFTAEIQGKNLREPMMVMTLAPGSWTAGHVILWQQDGNLETQWFPITAARDNRTTFLTGGSAVVHALHETTNGQWELGIVYDAAPFGSGSPTARFALLGLEEGEWHLLWDSGADEGWRGSHGRVEFPQGDLSEMVVRSDSWSQRGDVLSTVIHESNPGPHRFFVDTWLREGDRYVLASAETVAAPYATLVEFIYILGTGDDAGAREYVTDAGLVERAREHGLAGVPRQHWLSTCESGLECGKTEPIRFDPRPTRGEPQVAVYFEERDGRWLISYIQPESGS